jgi:uncharacterized radical SAM protein YgiQ
MRKARALPGVKRAFVASGVRYDVAFADEKHGDEYIRELVANHVGGHLKIAPEHISPNVVRVMKKPEKDQFVRFKELFEKYSDEAGKEQYLVPYFISGHPGCEVKDMVELSDYLAENGWRPQQVQDFTPTPMTLATDMYWSGYEPTSMQPVHVPKDADEKTMQRALLQPHLPQFRAIARDARMSVGAPPAPARKTPRPGKVRASDSFED